MKWRDIRTGLAVVTEPAIEPVSRAEAKWQARVDHTDEDHLFDAYIAAARRQIVKDTGRVPVNTVFDFTLDAFPEERWIRFPRWPLSSIGSVKSYDDDDTESTFASSKYFVDTVNHRIALNDGESWPTDLRAHNAGIVRFTAGGNDSSVSVSSLTSSGTAPDVTATVTTASAHGYSTGDRVTIAGANQDAYNGTFVIAVTDADAFTYGVVSGTPAAIATGTITARKLNVPANVYLATLLLVAMYYERRLAVELVQAGRSLQELPLGYAALIGGADRHYAMA